MANVQRPNQESLFKKAFSRLDEFGVYGTLKLGSGFLRRKSNLFSQRLKFRWSIDDLKRRMRTEQDIEDILNTAYRFEDFSKFGDIKPAQVRTELEAFLNFLDGEDVSVIVEIGTSRGGTLYTFMRHLNPDKVVSIDVPGGSIPPFFLDEMSGDKTDFLAIRGNSHDESTFKRLRDSLENEIDLLLIDGDHTYEGVKSDYEMYSRLVGQNSYIAFHDIHETDNIESVEVPRFWREIKSEHEDSHELVSEADDLPYHGWGILEK